MSPHRGGALGALLAAILAMGATDASPTVRALLAILCAPVAVYLGASREP